MRRGRGGSKEAMRQQTEVRGESRTTHAGGKRGHSRVSLSSPWLGGTLAIGITATLLLVWGQREREQLQAPDSFSPLLTNNERVMHKGRSPVSSDASLTDYFNSFGFDLFERLANGSQNVFISPLSINMALSMAAAGASPGSATEKEFASVLRTAVNEKAGLSILGGGKSIDPKVQLKIANSAWVRNAIKPEFSESIHKDFGADIEQMPESADVINKWVSKATDEMITKIIEEIPDLAIAILVNAVFFKGQWTVQFDPNETTDAPFTTSETRKMTVKMMRVVNESFPHAEVTLSEGKKIRLLDLPYGAGKYSATIVLPSERTSVDDIVCKLKDGHVTEWKSWMSRMVSTKLIRVEVPRFKLEYGAKSLKQELSAMGLKEGFVGDPRNGAFLKMTDDKKACIGDIVHKAVVECTEEGTKASGATGVIMMTRSLAIPPPPFVVDRPFIFAIRNRESGAVIFLGRIDSPSVL